MTVVVLVVEDDPHTREFFRTALRDEGYSVIALSDGLDALTYMDTHTPSAVVLDLGLPRLDGRDVLREMVAKDLTRRVPVVVVTGEDTTDLRERDFGRILHKPIEADELRDAIRECIGLPTIAKS